MAAPTNEQLAEFGAAVRERRLKLQYSQTYVAEQCNVSTSQMNNVEQSHNHPSLSVYFEICRVLKMPRPAFAPQTEELP